jgi:uncharacterized protein (DUF1501 family)
MNAADPHRRRALGALTLGGASLLTAPAYSIDAATGAPSDRKLVVVMLRGAIDGLSVVVPHGDAEYRRNRPDLAIAAPGQTDGALALDALFGLHPALAPLEPWWRSGHLGFVHASGSTDPTRSHFDAQDHLETATPGRRSTPDGWLNRTLAALHPGPDRLQQPTRGVNLGPTMPRILSGPAQVAAMPLGGADRRAPADAAGRSGALDSLHQTDAATSMAWQAMRETRQAMAESVTDPAQASTMRANAGRMDGTGMDAGIAPGAVPLTGLAQDAARLGRLMRREASVRVGFLSVGGWDTHTQQGAAQGQLANRMRVLAGGLDGLARGLDDRFSDTVILVMSEFGRTVRQNGTRGTDHGHGNVMWLLGGPVRGARVHGQWPGLEGSALHEGRDLAVTTDFRQVIASVLTRHLQLDDRALTQVLPDGAGQSARLDLLKG